MTKRPSPAGDPSVSWRSAIATDPRLLAEHTRRIHEAERLESLPGVGFFAWLLVQPGLVLARDLLVATTPDEGIVADGGAWLHSSDTGARCIIWAETSPGHERLRPTLLRWVEDRARHRLADAPNDRERVIRISVEAHRTQYRQAIERAGFESPRVFADMARPLSALPDPPVLPAGIRVVPWSDDLEEATRGASNASFADHWGSVAMSAEEFRGFFGANPDFRPDLSFLAVTGSRVVAFCLCDVDEEDNADRDTDDLYVSRVGTIAEYRGRRLATHLLVRSMEAAASGGTLDRAALQVDEMSHTGATRIYERLGFETYARSFHYTKTV